MVSEEKPEYTFGFMHTNLIVNATNLTVQGLTEEREHTNDEGNDLQFVKTVVSSSVFG